MTIKFFYNGIKINGKLFKGSYGLGGYTNGAKMAFYSDSYCAPELREHFKVKNDSDSMTDYFEKDVIYFFGNEPYFEDVKASWAKAARKYAKGDIERLNWVDTQLFKL